MLSHGTKGLNLLMYPSPIVSSGRLRKISASLQSSGQFTETHIVGIDTGQSTSAGELAPDVRVVRIPGANLKQRFGGIRVMLFWPFRVYRHYKSEQLSAVAAQNVYLLPLAYHLSRRTGALMAYNAHELETETIGATGIKQRIARFIERRYIRKADVVSVVNEPIAEWYRTHYKGVEPVVLTNTPVDAGGEVPLKSQLDIPDDELLYIHVGFLMGGRNIPLLLETFAQNPKVHLAFLGDGYLRPEVETAASAYANIHLLPLVAPEEVVSVVRGADVGLCLVEHVSLSDKLSTPNKLMECLAAGIPPLSSDIVEARRRLGPVLSKTWILDSPENQLDAALKHIGFDDIVEFKRLQLEVPTWDLQAADLVAAYRRAFEQQGEVRGQ